MRLEPSNSQLSTFHSQLKTIFSILCQQPKAIRSSCRLCYTPSAIRSLRRPRFTFHISRFTFNFSRFTPYASPFTRFIALKHELQPDEIRSTSVHTTERQLPCPAHFCKGGSFSDGDRRRNIDLQHLIDLRRLIHQDQHAPAADIERERSPTGSCRRSTFYSRCHLVGNRPQQGRPLTMVFMTVLHRPLPLWICHVAPPLDMERMILA